MEIKVRQIAELIKAEIEGNDQAVITHPDKIEDAGAGAITFYSNPKYEKYLYATGATAVIVHHDFLPEQQVAAVLLSVPDIYIALSHMILYYEKNLKMPTRI